MQLINKLLFGLAVLAFLLAVVVVLFTGKILNISAEGFSRACTNIALLNIILLLMVRKKQKGE